MTLYEITHELRNATDTVPGDGEVPDALVDALARLEGDIAHKVQQCCRALRNLDAESKALSDEANRLMDRAGTANAKIERLKEYVLGCLTFAGLTSVDAGVFRVRIQANGQPSVKCSVDPSTLPPELVRVQVGLDRGAVLDLVRAGKPLPEGITVERGWHLRIY